MLQPFIDALIPFMPGYLELPESYVGLLKSASHRYIKRVPKAGGGYRYFYHVGHGSGVAHEDHFVPGASFRFDGGHYHIKSEEGGKLVIEHDETKERKTVSKTELRSMLTSHHEPAIKAHREKVAGMLAEARANKASPKQIAKLEARAKAAGIKTTTKKQAPTGIDRLDKRIAKIKEEIEASPISEDDKAKLLAGLPEKNPKRKGDGYSDGAADDEYDDYGDMVERSFKRDLNDAVKRARDTSSKAGPSVEEVLSEVPEYQRRAYRDDTASELRAKAKSIRKQAEHTGDDDPSLRFKTADQIAQRKAEKHRDATFMERLADAKDRAAR